jgi:hypothetical protein
MPKSRPPKTDEPRELTEEELERENAEPLPDREQMSIVFPGPPGIELDPGDLTTEPVPPATL